MTFDRIVLSIVNSKSKTLLAFCFSFLLGVVAVSIIDKQFDLVWYYLGFFFIGSFLFLCWKQPVARFFVFLCCCFLLGAFRYAIAFPISSHNVSRLVGQTRTIIGIISAEPDVRSDGVRYIVAVDDEHVNGKVYLKLPRYPAFLYGDRLRLVCDLQAPQPIVDSGSGKVFRYDRYLSTLGVFTLCLPKDVKKIGSAGNPIVGKLLDFKRWVSDTIGALWHEPYAGFMAGILYGYHGGLGDLDVLFQRAGVTHIIAVSGSNISIIAATLLALASYFLIPRQKAFYGILFGIFAFTLFTGASGSAVRAAIMASLVLLARQWGRLSGIGSVMVVTTAIMTILNPFVLCWDVGFQLSMLSTLGIIYLSPIIMSRLDFLPETLALRETVATTSAAIISTLPLSLYQFGQLSLVALIVNPLILWSIPLLMFVGFLAVVCGLVSIPLGQLLAWFGWVGMAYVVAVVRFFAQSPLAALQFFLPWWLLILLYLGLGIFVSWWYKKKRTFAV